MIDLSLDDFLNLDESQRCVYIKDYAILYAQQFDRPQLDYYCRLADACRALNKTPRGAEFMAGLLPHRRALNFFIQPSSRTFLSFNVAEEILGMHGISLRSAAISSMSKGETLVDSVRTFMSYIDLLVSRHPDADAGAAAFWVAMKGHRRLLVNGEERPLPVISGGSGAKQHPTQSLLDIYTLEKSFDGCGGIDGKKIMLVGDLSRGRTVRSLSYLMKNYRGVELFFAAPDKYQMQPDILEFLDRHHIPYTKIDAISDAISEVDAVYMTRIQDEHDNLAPGTHVKAHKDFVFTMEHLRRMKDRAYLLHPLPKRDEVDLELDYCDDPRVVYWRQERNGMWMRVGIIARLFRVDDEIMRVARESGVVK